MKHKNTVKPKHAPLLSLFLDGYETMRRQMDEPCRQPLLELAPLAFSKWYYTALAADTILSPANIFGIDLDGTDEYTDHAYLLRTLSAAEKAKTEYLSEYSFALYRYSLEAHPLIDDLKTLIDHCTPDCATDEEGFLLPEDREAVMEQLSLKDGFYLEYLTRLAWMQGLFLPMPSIHTKRLQPSAECEHFFTQSTADILTELGKTACELTAERFMETMDMDDGIATTDFFLSCLEKNKYVDHIFIDFYKRVDIDIEEIWKAPPEELNMEQRSVVSSFLFTGIMLDKWFLTPMSVFFHFIRPIHFTPIRFFQMVNNLTALMMMEHNVGSELFTPPTYYSLTPLGEKLFKDPEDTEPNRQKMPKTVPFEQILSAVEQEAELQRQEQMLLMEYVPDVVSIRITSLQDTELWKIIELSEDMELHHFCVDLSMLFHLDGNMDYLLSVPDENGFPMEYSSKGSKRSINKTHGKELRALSLSAQNQMLLYPTPNKSIAYSLEVLEKGKGNPYLIYPRITGQSRKIVESERFDETF